MRLAELDVLLVFRQDRGAQHDEDGVAVLLELGPLVSELGVFNRQVVETELVLNLLEELGGGIVETDPHEDARLLEDLADVWDGDVAEAPTFRVGDTGYDAVGWSFCHVRSPSPVELPLTLPSPPLGVRESEGVRRARARRRAIRGS
jgi:hypothetical protein